MALKALEETRRTTLKGACRVSRLYLSSETRVLLRSISTEREGQKPEAWKKR